MMNTETSNTETVDQAMIEKEIGKVSAFIDTARKHIKEDKMVDVVALEEKVRSLCSKVKDSSDKDSESVRPAIIKIREDLDRLDKELTRQFKRVTASMAGATRNHATAAYAKSGDDA